MTLCTQNLFYHAVVHKTASKTNLKKLVMPRFVSLLPATWTCLGSNDILQKCGTNYFLLHHKGIWVSMEKKEELVTAEECRRRSKQGLVAWPEDVEEVYNYVRDRRHQELLAEEEEELALMSNPLPVTNSANAHSQKTENDDVEPECTPDFLIDDDDTFPTENAHKKLKTQSGAVALFNDDYDTTNSKNTNSANPKE